MSDDAVLTQREIDSLLNAAGAPAPAAAEGTAPDLGALRRRPPSIMGKTIKRYDFRRPDKFSKEQLRSLQAMHETLARGIGTTLSSQLRSNVDIKVSSIDQGLYEEYAGNVPTPAYVHVFQMAPLDGSVILSLDHGLGMLVVDRLLGGQGQILDRPHETTDIELQLLHSVGHTLAEELANAWENLAHVQPALQEIHQDIQFAALAPPAEVVIMVLMEVTLLGTVSGLSVATPFSVLEPVMDRLNAQAWVGTRGRKQRAAAGRGHLQTQVQRTPTQLRVELGSATVRAAEIANLRIGDVIQLEGTPAQPVPVYLGRIRKWIGRPGLVGRRLAVELARWAPAEMPSTARKSQDRNAPADAPVDLTDLQPAPGLSPVPMQTEAIHAA